MNAFTIVFTYIVYYYSFLLVLALVSLSLRYSCLFIDHLYRGNRKGKQGRALDEVRLLTSKKDLAEWNNCSVPRLSQTGGSHSSRVDPEVSRA